MSAYALALTLALLPSVWAQLIYENATSLGVLASAFGDDGLAFWQASQDPTFTTKLSFQGINLNDSITSSGSIATADSTQTWQLQLNLSAVTVQSSQSAVANLVYGLDFPETQLPLNDTDWQICGTIYEILSDSVSDRAVSSGNGSCVPYLGEACVNDFMRTALDRTAISASGCSGPPALSSIPSCANRFKGIYPSALTAVITNALEPGLVFNRSDKTYTNYITGQANITNPVAQGLTSGQAFGFDRYVFGDGANTTTKDIGTLAKSLRLVVLKAGPSRAFLGRGQTGAFAYEGGVRMICGRIDSSGAAAPLRPGTVATSFVALATLFVMLW